jgi:hypothetical protein
MCNMFGGTDDICFVRTPTRSCRSVFEYLGSALPCTSKNHNLSAVVQCSTQYSLVDNSCWYPTTERQPVTQPLSDNNHKLRSCSCSVYQCRQCFFVFCSAEYSKCGSSFAADEFLCTKCFELHNETSIISLFDFGLQQCDDRSAIRAFQEILDERFQLILSGNNTHFQTVESCSAEKVLCMSRIERLKYIISAIFSVMFHLSTARTFVVSGVLRDRTWRYCDKYFPVIVRQQN